MNDTMDLSDRVVLVIGGSGGIGQALCRGFAAAGASVAVAAREPARVRAVADGLAAAGWTAAAHRCDANAPDAVRRTIDAVVSTQGRLDVVVNCQGTTVIKPAADFAAADYDKVMDTNLKSVFFACLAAHARFTDQGGGGSIINIASLAAHRGWPGSVVYGMSKHGVLALTRGLAGEWAKDGVRVNSISPGFFMTDLNRERMGPERKAAALARTPMARFGEVEELAGAAIYLASDAARFVTGTDIAVDGGYLATGI